MLFNNNYVLIIVNENVKTIKYIDINNIKYVFYI